MTGLVYFFITFTVLAFAVITPLLLLRASSIRKSYQGSFYGYSNMRIICGNKSEIIFFYFKDIHEITVGKKGTVNIDTNEYVGEYTSEARKMIHRIIGVADAKGFVETVREKILPFLKAPI